MDVERTGNRASRLRGRARSIARDRHRSAGAANRSRTESLRVIERFTRVDADTLRYEFTVEDPTRWTSPWSGEPPLRMMLVRTRVVTCRLSPRVNASEGVSSTA